MALLEQARAGQEPMTATMDQAPAPGAAPVDAQGAMPGGGMMQGNPQDPLGGGPRLAASEQQAGPPSPEGEEPATPEEQAEYERVMDEIIDVVYGESGGDKTSDAIADSIIPEDKIGSLIQAGTMLIGTMDQKLDMDDTVIPQVVEDVTEMLADVAEKKNGIEFSQEEMESGLMGIWEGVMYLVGGDSPIEPDFQEATQGMSQQDLASMHEEYNSRLGSAAERQDHEQSMSIPMAQGGAGGQPS